MTNDKIIVSRSEIETLLRRARKGNIFQSEISDILDKAEKSQVEPVATVKDGYIIDKDGKIIDEFYSFPNGTELYTSPPADKQDADNGTKYCCIESWKKAKDEAWSKRNFKLCKCDHCESCEHCFPQEFHTGGKWDLCKPNKAIDAAMKGER